jgi:hypothetical protein
LDDLEIEPCFLNLGPGWCLSDRLNGGDSRVADAFDRGDAGTNGSPVQMHGAGAAQRPAATEFRAGHAEHVAQHPKQRGVPVDIGLVIVAVDFDFEGHREFRID